MFVWRALLHCGIWFQMKGLSSSWLMLSISCEFTARHMMKGRGAGFLPWTWIMKYCADTTDRSNWGRCWEALIALLFISRLLWGLAASVKFTQLWNSKKGAHNSLKGISRRTLILNSCYIQKTAMLPSCVCFVSIWGDVGGKASGYHTAGSTLWQCSGLRSSPSLPAGQQSCSQSSSLLRAAFVTGGKALLLSKNIISFAFKVLIACIGIACFYSCMPRDGGVWLYLAQMYIHYLST